MTAPRRKPVEAYLPKKTTASARGRFPTEKELVNALIAEIKRRGGGVASGAHARKHVASGPWNEAGEPDIVGCVQGRMVQVEAKQPGKRPTAVQYGSMRRWQQAGAFVCWVTSVEQLEELLDAHLHDYGWQNPQLGEGP